MTIKQFNLFSEPEQDEIIFNYGTYITSYIHGNTMADVYKMDSFFVKFSYDITKDKKPSIFAFFDDNGFNVFNDALSHVRCN